MEADSQVVTQRLYLADKDFKITILNMFNQTI